MPKTRVFAYKVLALMCHIPLCTNYAPANICNLFNKFKNLSWALPSPSDLKNNKGTADDEKGVLYNPPEPPHCLLLHGRIGKSREHKLAAPSVTIPKQEACHHPRALPPDKLPLVLSRNPHGPKKAKQSAAACAIAIPPGTHPALRAPGAHPGPNATKGRGSTHSMQ